MSKEKKLHFNFIDILIILCFAVLVIGFAFYATGNWQTNNKSTTALEEKQVQYVVFIDGAIPQLTEAIKVGDVLKDSARETILGEIAEIRNKEHAKITVYNENKEEYVKTAHPETYSFELVIKSNYSLEDDTVVIDGTEIKVGKSLHFKTDRYAVGGYIVAVDKNN